MDKQPCKFEDTDLIEVMNISNGKLIYAPKFRECKLVFEKPGDVKTITWEELKFMRSAYFYFIRRKWIKILNDDAIKLLEIHPEIL